MPNLILFVILFMSSASIANSYIVTQVSTAAINAAAANSRRTYDYSYPRHYQEVNFEYNLSCSRDGNAIQYASMPFDYNSNRRCVEALDKICTKKYVNGEQISNETYSNLSYFYSDGEALTAQSVNNLCENNKKVLK